MGPGAGAAQSLSVGRRRALGAAAGFALLALSGPTADARTPAPAGPATPSVTLTEYASLTCRHCAEFHAGVMPTIKARFIDTGRVRHVFKAFPTAPHNLSAAMHVIADCAGPRRDALIDAMMRAQARILSAATGPGGAKPVVLAIAAEAGGLDEARVEACLSDPARIARVNADVAEGVAAGVVGTPTLFIDGRRYEPGPEGPNVADLTAALEAALAVKAPASPPRPANARAPRRGGSR